MPVEEVEPGVFDFITSYLPTSRRTYFYRAWAVLKAEGRSSSLCESCGYLGNQVHAHHIDRDITNSRSTNLLVLCRKCHKKEHPKRLNFSYEDIYASVPLSEKAL